MLLSLSNWEDRFVVYVNWKDCLENRVFVVVGLFFNRARDIWGDLKFRFGHFLAYQTSK